MDFREIDPWPFHVQSVPEDFFFFTLDLFRVSLPPSAISGGSSPPLPRKYLGWMLHMYIHMVEY
jgi:hypothetical protein